MSAVFSILDGIAEVIGAIIGAIIAIVEGLVGVAPMVAEAVVAVAGVFVAAAEAAPSVLGGIGEVAQGAGQVINAQIASYISWFAVEALLLAFFPELGFVINAGFFVLAIYGLWQGVDEILWAPTMVVAGLAFIALMLNGYLFFAVG